MTDRAVSSVVLVLVLTIALLLAFLLFPTIVDEQAIRMQEAARQQAEAACNERLPGDGWEVADWQIVNASADELQTIACTRDGNLREIEVEINIQLEG